MHRQCLLLAVVCAGTLVTVVRAQDSDPKPDVKIYPLKGAYGTLIYEGTVERSGGGDAYQFVVRELKFKYDPKARTNRTPQIEGQQLSFSVGKKPPQGEERGTSLFRDQKPISIFLNEDSPPATVQNITFFVPREAVEKADFISLGVTDGRLMWPIRLWEAPGQKPPDAAGPGVEIYHPQGEHGTLNYEGTVERKEVGEKYEYTVRELELTFNPRGKANKTSKIETKFIELAAVSQPSKGKTRGTTLHQEKKPLSVVLNQKSLTDTIENIKFTVPKASIDKADSVILNISDGKLVWPIRLTESAK